MGRRRDRTYARVRGCTRVIARERRAKADDIPVRSRRTDEIDYLLDIPLRWRVRLRRWVTRYRPSAS